MKIQTIVNQNEEEMSHIGDFRGDAVFYLGAEQLLRINNTWMQIKIKKQAMQLTCIFGQLDAPIEFAQWLRHCFTVDRIHLNGRFKDQHVVVSPIKHWRRFK